MAKNSIYSAKSIQKRFGLTPNQYRSQFNVFERRVNNLNRLTGTNYNARREFRYSKLFPESETIKTIQSVSSTPNANSVKTINASKQYLENRYQGLMNSSPALREKFNNIGKDGYSLKDFNEDAKESAERLKNARRTDALVGSEEFFNESDVSPDLVSENEDFDFDEIF